jgi:hypothetical protein
MKTFSALRFLSLCGIFAISLFANGQAQTTKISFNAAYNMLNSGSKNVYGGGSASIGTLSGGGNASIGVLNGVNYTKKVQISYGIPIAILFEFITVKINLSSDLASDQDTYNNCSGDVQQALVNYNKVNVKLNFRFNPAKLVIYGSDQNDFLNNAHSSPWDVGVYKAPNTAMSGSKIMVVKK